MLFRSPKPQTPNPKPQTPNPKPLLELHSTKSTLNNNDIQFESNSEGILNSRRGTSDASRSTTQQIDSRHREDRRQSVANPRLHKARLRPAVCHHESRYSTSKYYGNLITSIVRQSSQDPAVMFFAKLIDRNASYTECLALGKAISILRKACPEFSGKDKPFRKSKVKVPEAIKMLIQVFSKPS